MNVPRSSRAVQSLSPSKPWRNPAENHPSIQWNTFKCCEHRLVRAPFLVRSKQAALHMGLKIEYPKIPWLIIMFAIEWKYWGHNPFQTIPSAISKEQKTCISNLFKSQVKHEYGYCIPVRVYLVRLEC
jgi:hypothetical protein